MSKAPTDHRHILGTVFVANPPKTAAEGEQWLRALIDRVGMEILMDAQAVACQDLGNEGITGTAALTTSHASFHSWDKVSGHAFINFDLYSCKPFKSEDVISLLDESFEVISGNYVVIDRNHFPTIIEAVSI